MLDMADFSLFEEEISRIYSDIETELIDAVIRSLISGRNLDAGDWRLRKLSSMGDFRRNLQRRISRLMLGSEKDLEKAVEDIVRLSASEDAEYFGDIRRFANDAFASGISMASSSDVSRRIRAIMVNCRDALNLTNTGALEAALRSYRDAINSAYASVMEGSSSLDAAIRKACRQLGGSGLRLHYISESGNPASISLDAGIRRNIVTSVNQATAGYTIEDCERNGCDLVQTSAHAGARPSHQVWQGKVFSLSGRSRKYGSLEAETGYGTAGGLCGINCKHSFFPYYEGMQKTDWHIDLTARQNEELYNDIQKQRYYERNIRSWKRRRDEARLSGDAAEYARAGAKVREWQKGLRGFLSETGLPRRMAREQV